MTSGEIMVESTPHIRVAYVSDLLDSYLDEVGLEETLELLDQLSESVDTIQDLIKVM